MNAFGHYIRSQLAGSTPVCAPSGTAVNRKVAAPLQARNRTHHAYVRDLHEHSSAASEQTSSSDVPLQGMELHAQARVATAEQASHPLAGRLHAQAAHPQATHLSSGSARSPTAQPQPTSDHASDHSQPPPTTQPQPQLPTRCLTIDPTSFAFHPPSHITPSSYPSHIPPTLSHSPHTTNTIDLTLTPPTNTTPSTPSPPHLLSHIQHDPPFHTPPAPPPTPTYTTDLAALQEAALLLQQGETVAMPTETVYGLAADALQPAAVKRIFAAKQRPADNPLIVHVSSLDMLERLYPPGWSLPAAYVPVVAAHWPGPLTILLPRSKQVSDDVVCGHSTMAVRMPAHPVARALIALSGAPLAAPSANSSGRPSPTLAAHVMSDLRGRVPLVLDGGPCGCGVESTVLDALRQPPAVLRPGGVTTEQLETFPSMAGLQVYRKHYLDLALEAAPTTPGMKYRHYSPNAPVTLLDVQSSNQDVQSGNQGALLGHQGSSGQDGTVQTMRAAAAERVARLVWEAAEVAIQQQQEINAVKGFKNQLAGGEHAVAHDALSSTTEMEVGLIRIGVLRTSKGLECQPGLTEGNQAMHYDIHCTDSQVEGPGWDRTKAEVSEHSAVSGVPRNASVEVIEYVLGDLADPACVARELFVALRLMDELKVVSIVAEGVRECDEGLAVMNRLRKASSQVVGL